MTLEPLPIHPVDYRFQFTIPQPVLRIPAMSRSKNKPGIPPAAPPIVASTELPASGRLELWGYILFATVLTTIFLLCCFPITDFDFWWHLKTGQLIWQNKEIPRFDWYTYKDADRPWIDLHWGFQLLIAGLFHLGGTSLIILFKAAGYTATTAIGWLTVGARLPGWLKAILWVCPLVLLAGRAYERPEIISMVGLAAVLWILHRIDERPRLVWWLVPLQLVWINFHALSVVGLVAGWTFVAGRLVEMLWQNIGLREQSPGQPISSRIPLQTLILAMTAATLAGLANPYFWDGLIFPEVLLRKFMSERELYKTIGEFGPPSQFIERHGVTGNVNPLALTILTWISALSFVVPLITGRFNPFRAILLAGFGWLAWTAVRNQNLFALVAVVVMCGNLNDVWGVPKPAKHKKHAPAPQPFSLPNSVHIVASCLALILYGVWVETVVTSVWGLSGWTDGIRPFGLGEKPDWFAHGAMKFAGQEGLPNYAYVSHGQAPLYIYHNGPDRKVFTDPRLEVASQKTYQEFGTVMQQMARGNPAWMETVRGPDGQLPVVVLHRGSKQGDFPSIAGIGAYFSDRWRLVYIDKISCVFVEEQLAEKLHLLPPPPSSFGLTPEQLESAMGQTGRPDNPGGTK